eukprot:g10400.t1
MFDTVEVRWPSHPFLWHRARLWDLHEVPGSGTCVACDTGDRSLTQPSFPVQDVRLPPPADADLTGFDPQPGELVEYEVLPTDTTPAGWAVAQVVAVSGRFWQLRWPERWGERMGEVLMPLSRLRPCVSPKGNVENLLRKEEVVVDRELLAEDTSSCFRRVESLAVGLQAQETTELLRIRKVTLEPKILAIGTVKAVQRAKILIPSMLHNHRKANNLQERSQFSCLKSPIPWNIQKCDEATKKREQALAMRSMKKLRDAWNPKEVPDSLVKDEFMMDSLHVGRLIGKGGSNIRALQNELDVKICIFDKDEKKTLGQGRHVMRLGIAPQIPRCAVAVLHDSEGAGEGEKWICSTGPRRQPDRLASAASNPKIEEDGLTDEKRIFVPGMGVQDAGSCMYLSPNLEGYGELLGKIDLQPWLGFLESFRYPSLRELFVDRLHVTTSLSSHGCLEALRSLRGTASSEAKKLMKLRALKQMKGVKEVEVNLLRARANVTFDATISTEQLAEEVECTGFDASVLTVTDLTISDAVRRVELRVEGMTCAACSGAVERALKALSGVLDVQVSLLRSKAVVRCTVDAPSADAMADEVEACGFEAKVSSENEELPEGPRPRLQPEQAKLHLHALSPEEAQGAQEARLKMQQ